MQEFLKNEQDKYIYYYNDNELKQFYLYQQMPENNEIDLHNKQEFFKQIFKDWKLKQINFLLQQIILDIQNYFPEKNDLANSLTELDIFRSILNSNELNVNSKSIEKANLNDLNSCKNQNLILYNNINNFTLIQGNNSVQINENKNFNNNNNNNKININNNNLNNLNQKTFCKNQTNHLNTVSINDICNDYDGNNGNNDNNDNNFNEETSAFNLNNKEIDFSFFSCRINTQKLIRFLLNIMKGMEKEMIVYIQDELNKNNYLANESIYYLMNCYNSICSSRTKPKIECKYIFLVKFSY